MFEVVLPEKDPHIIEYESDKLVLLDIVKRQMKYEKLLYEDVLRFAETFRVECKQKSLLFISGPIFINGTCLCQMTRRLKRKDM